MTSEDLVWRDLVADWHLKRPAPLECACDDDTEDGAFCPPSIEWADEEYASRHEPSLAGPADPWDHQVWVAAWGHNAPVFTNYNDYKLPKVKFNNIFWTKFTFFLFYESRESFNTSFFILLKVFRCQSFSLQSFFKPFKHDIFTRSLSFFFQV